jgi:hypothetical protein
MTAEAEGALSAHPRQKLNIKSVASVVRTKLGRSLIRISFIPGIQSTTFSRKPFVKKLSSETKLSKSVSFNR